MGPADVEIYQVPAKLSFPEPIKTVSCGQWHMLALSTSGVVYSAGSNKNFELGREGS